MKNYMWYWKLTIHKKQLPLNNWLVLLNEFIMSHLQYPAILFNKIAGSLLISHEKHLIWAGKT